jgi:ABC-type iron transport system FetAB ATPase subunit
MLAVEERTLLMLREPGSTVKAVLWITRSDEQGQRVGTRFITLSGGKAVKISLLQLGWRRRHYTLYQQLEPHTTLQ